MRKNTGEKAKQLLHKAHIKITAGRVNVLKVLLEAERPISREDIAESLGGKSPNRVTIYRILDVLAKANIVHKAFIRDRAWHFEPAHNCTEKQCHPHFTCRQCSRTYCLTEMTVPMAASSHKGFLISHQRVQLEGLCPECRTI